MDVFASRKCHEIVPSPRVQNLVQNERVFCLSVRLLLVVSILMPSVFLLLAQKCCRQKVPRNCTIATLPKSCTERAGALSISSIASYGKHSDAKHVLTRGTKMLPAESATKLCHCHASKILYRMSGCFVYQFDCFLW